jgi:hypothetical protein
MIQLVLMLGGYLALLTIAVWLIGAFTGRDTSDPPAASRAEGRRKPPPKPTTRRLGAHKGASAGKGPAGGAPPHTEHGPDGGATYAPRARLAHLREHDSSTLRTDKGAW